MKKIIFLTLLFFSFISQTSNNSNLKNILETTYHLKINSNITNYPGYNIEPINNIIKINPALNTLNQILTNFTPEFFTNFFNYNYNGLEINFVDNITPIDSNIIPSAISLDYQKKYTIVVNINKEPLNKIICHELMHIMEFNIQKEQEPFPNWNTYNPSNFSYNYSYNAEYNYNYTLYHNNSNNVYFIDYYTYSYPEEDRARIFENICANHANLSYYPHIYNKALYLQEEILNFYPTLKNTNLFQNYQHNELKNV